MGRETAGGSVETRVFGIRGAYEYIGILFCAAFRRIVQGLTRRGVRVEFVKESLFFTSDDSPMATLMLSVMGAFAEFEQALIRERQREGIALARQRGAYRDRRKSLSPERIAELRRRAAAGEKQLHLARDFGISPETLYQYLKTNAGF